MMHVYANATATVATRGGGTATVELGKVYSSHNPIVQDNPSLFSTTPTVVDGEKVKEPQVEEATAAPGAKRAGAKRAKGA